MSFINLHSFLSKQKSIPGKDDLERIIHEYGKLFAPCITPKFSECSLAEDVKDILHNKFGGIPYCSEAYPHVMCSECGETSYLLCQIDLSTVPPDILPPSIPTRGLLQAFLCCADCGDMGTVRIIPQDTLTHPHVIPSYALDLLEKESEKKGAKDDEAESEAPPSYELQKGPFKCNRVTSWSDTQYMLPYNNIEDAFTYVYGKEVEESIRGDLDLLQEMADAIVPSGDYFGGWSVYIQSTLTECECSTCKSVVMNVVQIESECGVEYGFCDCGRAYVTVCPNHLSELEITWDCD
ncbi:Protein of unknown function DUF1963 like protein [Aduncisulcus paluster]|uniref:Uncharacterized protein n=1 Tax=Aduncisulcus paluster TaxID=2918883 RepID=A0ABQ5KVZ4_9EUKA|nr:Protein of unknown function DUF1963 like protein [Aduncisulcus paluster]